MRLRTRLWVYWGVLHLALAVLLFLVLESRSLWLLVGELALVLSLLTGARLIRTLGAPLGLARTGTELLRERDYGSFFRPTGETEVDELVSVYNQMAQSLRQERLKLREQNLFLDKLLLASPVGVLILDLDGRIEQVNPAAVELLEQPVVELLERGLGEIPGPMAAALARVPGDASTLVGVGPRRLKVSAAHVYDRGFPRRFYLIEEVTAELHRSERQAYGQLVRMISHEVNNSVSAVVSLLGSFAAYSRQLKAADRDEFETALAVAGERMQSLNGFINGFADVVRLPAPRLRPCDLTKLLDDIEVLLAPELERRRILWTWRRREEVGPVPADSLQLEQVLVNVVRNAIEAIGTDGEIEMELAPGRGQVELVIADSGAGLPADVEDKLFLPFFSTKRDGRGLGLTLVREILSQHGWQFGLHPRQAGGCEFRIRVPSPR